VSKPFTRKEYVASVGGDYHQSLLAHRRYYSQFVNDAVTGWVVTAIGEDRILKSTNPHFTDIPSHEWGALEPILRVLCKQRLINLGDEWFVEKAICVAKEAARQMREAPSTEGRPQ